jgi:rhodanese-related sulfurtransferase
MIRIFIFLSLIFIFSCNSAIKNEHVNMDIIQFSNLTDPENYTLLDVRTNEERINGYLLNSTHIDYYDKRFIEKINLLDKNKPVYVYCKVGGRSLKVSNKLIQFGFKNVYNLEGGFLRWSNNQLPIEYDSLSLLTETKQEFNKQYLDSIIQQNETTLIYISTKWCAPCKKMNPLVDKFSNDFVNKLSVIRFDLDRNLFLNEFYNISSIPLFVLYKNNQEVWRKNGIIAYGDIADKL